MFTRKWELVDNLSLCFERVTDPQFTAFLSRFTPGGQFGFRKKCGTDDYAAVLSSTLHCALEKRMEAILVTMDVAGAFDKWLMRRVDGKSQSVWVWWESYEVIEIVL